MDRLLARIRDALAGTDPVAAPDPVAPSGADIGPDLLEAFRRALEAADGQLEVVSNESAARQLVADRWPDAALVSAEEDPDEGALRGAEVGLDRADRLIAETGTVVRTYPTRAAARAALVPPVSVFLAPRGALVRDLPTALAELEGTHGSGRTYSVLVTGPSRTADIEKQLVIPAHGPRELLVVLFDG